MIIFAYYLDQNNTHLLFIGKNLTLYTSQYISFLFKKKLNMLPYVACSERLQFEHKQESYDQGISFVELISSKIEMFTYL